MATPQEAKSVEPGLYRTPDGIYFERFWLNRKRTWRRLYSRTLKDAREEMSAKRSDHKRSKLGLTPDPYQKPRTVTEVLQRYLSDNTPDQNGQKRPVNTALQEQARCAKLLPHFGPFPATELSFSHLVKYGETRNAPRAADLELNTLNNALEHARRHGLIKTNPLRDGRPKFKDSKTVRHCRDTAPLSGDELHDLAEDLFSGRGSEPLGWQLLIEAFTGCRTSEALRLRMDAKTKQDAGFIENQWLWLKRSKNGTNPFALIHPALAACIAAHRRWHTIRWANHPAWFPHRYDRESAVCTTALVSALQKAAKLRGLGPRTSHGLRAFFVTMRRSEGVSDGQIAAEIGDSTGAAIIASTYGAIPPNWQGGKGLTWLPSNGVPAWDRVPSLFERR